MDGHKYKPVSVYIILMCNLFPLLYSLGLYSHQFIIYVALKSKVSSFFRIHPNLRSTIYCNAIAAGGAKEWNFAWSAFQNATIAIEADKLRSALACTKQPWLLNRSAHIELCKFCYTVQWQWLITYKILLAVVLVHFRYLEYTLDPSKIRKQDATSTIVYIANNVVGQPLAWDFVRARWSYIFTEWV